MALKGIWCDGWVDLVSALVPPVTFFLGSFQNCAAKFFIVIALLLSFHGCPAEQVARFEKKNFFLFEMPRA